MESFLEQELMLKICIFSFKFTIKTEYSKSLNENKIDTEF